MKYLVSQLTYFIADSEARRNLAALAQYLVFVLVVIAGFTVAFHFLMVHAEGETHSWITGLYWTLTVMSTLGFGDITFDSDIGRLFSIVVLVSGILLLLIMLPFAFIRFFYAPWLEAQIRTQAPRNLARSIRDHVVICHHDSIARGLIRRLELYRIPYVLIEPDPVEAGRKMGEGLSVVAGDVDSRATYEAVRVGSARMVFANAEDTTNTNITLTVRVVDADVPILALAEDEDSIDILELSGATDVLPLKRRLGESLAARVSSGNDAAHVVGRFEDLQIAEFVVHGTDLEGKTLEETRLRERTGINVVAVWEEGHLQPVRTQRPLTSSSVPVAVGTEAQLEGLNELLCGGQPSRRPVLVIGGGKVGRATTAALESKGMEVRVVEKNAALQRGLERICRHVTIGDAADRNVLEEAGLEEAGAVALTTNSDAVNIHLAVYCRRLKPELNIVSRITHERNIEAIYRAGADSALSYSSLGREHLVARLLGREPVMVGEGADFFRVPIPPSLLGKTLGESQIGARTGLIVIAVEKNGEAQTNPMASTPLEEGSCLLMLGTARQRERFENRLG